MYSEGQALADMWILDIERAIWRKEENVALKARYWHFLTAFSLGSGRTDVIEFGGTPDQFIGSDEKQPKKADTTLLQLRLSETSEWELLSIVNNTQLDHSRE
ncbi:hypothetical protein GBAR_LOCUS22450 [Geodia barretti]|uniref:Uncharacterized protein n=1 Tax=Geodia barretti TaxID=519541 RepID=A0AA35T2Y0_GEOBA|nr:hypothetical protein GBAR_LOCUS22450 [Geodia barretti]